MISENLIVGTQSNGKLTELPNFSTTFIHPLGVSVIIYDLWHSHCLDSSINFTINFKLPQLWTLISAHKLVSSLQAHRNVLAVEPLAIEKRHNINNFTLLTANIRPHKICHDKRLHCVIASHSHVEINRSMTIKF